MPICYIIFMLYVGCVQLSANTGVCLLDRLHSMHAHDCLVPWNYRCPCFGDQARKRHHPQGNRHGSNFPESSRFHAHDKVESHARDGVLRKGARDVRPITGDHGDVSEVLPAGNGGKHARRWYCCRLCASPLDATYLPHTWYVKTHVCIHMVANLFVREPSHARRHTWPFKP